MFEGIKKLLPGHILLYENGKVKIHKYWDLIINTALEKPEEFYIKNIRRLFRQSVERRLMSDVPLGVLLSGGIDSSSIVAVMSELVEEPIKTFSMGFGELDDELNDAQLVADRFETDHTDMLVNLDEVAALLPTMIWHADEPIINLPQGYMICRLVSKHVKVVNSGNGGDELFAGYIQYKYLDKSVDSNNIFLRGIKTKIVSNLISQIVKLQLKLGSPMWYEYRRRLDFIGSLNDKKKLYLLTRNALNVEEEKEKIYSNEILSQNFESVNDYFEPFFVTNNEFLDQVLVTECKTKLVDELLLSEDRVSMAHSLESRVPFLDTDLVEFVFTIPAHLKLKNGTTKYIFKKAMSNVLPDEILTKPKEGFGFEPSSLFKNSLKEYAEVFLSEENIRKRGYFKYDYIRQILNHKITPKLRWHYFFIMRLLAVEIWHRIYIDQDDLFRPKLDINDLY
jgi:asparagine synthase (glutamine-hydrolysing)